MRDSLRGKQRAEAGARAGAKAGARRGALFASNLFSENNVFVPRVSELDGQAALVAQFFRSHVGPAAHPTHFRLARIRKPAKNHFLLGAFRIEAYVFSLTACTSSSRVSNRPSKEGR